MDWGVKMIMFDSFTPVDLLSYQYLLVWISEEWGGVRTAYYYGMLNRTQMAKALEQKNNDLRPFLSVLNRDTLRDASRNVELRFKEHGGAQDEGNSPPGSGYTSKGKGKQAKGIQKGDKSKSGGKGNSQWYKGKNPPPPVSQRGRSRSPRDRGNQGGSGRWTR